MRSRYSSHNSDQWPRVSDLVWAIGEKHRPWQIGLLLLESSNGGIKHDTNSAPLTALIEQVKALYQSEAASEQTWLKAAETLDKFDSTTQVVDPLNGRVRWSESHALNALSLLIQAAQIRSTARPQTGDWVLPWHIALANACLQSAQYQGAIAAARYLTVEAPASTIYEERLRQMMAYSTGREKAAEERRQQAYSEMINYFRTVRAEFYRQEREEYRQADAAENARIDALPFFQRICSRAAKIWSESAG